MRIVRATAIPSGIGLKAKAAPGLESDAQEIRVVYGSIAANNEELAILSRPMLELLTNRVSFISVPGAHVLKHRVWPTHEDEGGAEGPPIDSGAGCTYKWRTSTPREPWDSRTDVHFQEGEESMKFGINFQLQTPKPLDADQWHEEDELKIYHEALEQIEFADKLGYDYVFITEHHFLEEYCHSSAPEVFLAAAAARTKNIRLGHGIVQMPPKQNHPARVAERIAALDLVSRGRVEFGTGEGATSTEIGGFHTVHEEKKQAWEEATRECLRMMTTVPYPGYEGKYFSMPERNVIPKPLQKPHPPVWVASSRSETVMLAARLGIGALGVGFETPEDTVERVTRYWELIRACRQPIGAAVNPGLIAGGNMFCAKTDEEAVKKGLSGAQFFGFVFGWMHGHATYGRDNVYREFRKRADAEDSAEAREAATELEPEDESARVLYRMGRRGLFIGSPRFIRDNVRQYEAAHLDILNLFSQCGDRKHEDII